MGMADQNYPRDLPPNGGGTRIGHFSFVTEGLKQCVTEGWITSEEAQREVRAMLPLVSKMDAQLRRAKQLREEADQIEEQALEDHPDD